MADDIRITKTGDGATLMVNITAIHEFIRQASIEGAMEILKSGIAAYLEKEGDRPMEKKRKSKIRKWDEVGGAVETEIDEMTVDAPEEPGMGPAISKHPMKGIEDMVEQNDNNLDGVINNLPEPKPAAQITSEDVIEAEQKKKSILEKIRESTPEPEKARTVSLCSDEFVRS